MSFNTAMGTITVDDVTYDVETHSTDLGQRLTIQFEGEDMFEGLEGLVENEEYIEEHHNPRDACNVGTMAISYRGYNLGGDDDEDISQIEFEVDCGNCEGHGTVAGNADDGEDDEIECPICGGEGKLPVNPVDYFKKDRGARVVIGLTVYEHSGITIRAGDVTLPWDSDRWDTSFVGFIFDTPEQLKETMGTDVTDEEIEKALREEISLYASYLEGDVCWFKVEDEESGFFESCGGFVGCQDECERECYSNLEYAIAKRIREDEERLYWLNREVLTV